MPPLDGRVIVAAGAGRGLGREAALALAERGAAVIINDINPDRAADTVERITAGGGRAEVYIADISKKFPVQAMFNAVEDQWGRLDAVVNNARVLPLHSLLEMDEWGWRRTLDVNLTGAFLLTQIAGRIMRSAGYGVIVHFIQTPPPSEALSAYAAAVAGAAAFGEAARTELAAANIHFHTIPYHQDGETGALDQALAVLQAAAMR